MKMDIYDSVTDSQTDAAEYKFNTVSNYYCSADESTDEPGHIPLPQTISQTYRGVLPNSPSQIILVGTAHVSEKSVRKVIETIEREQPDIVAVELCKGRYDALKGKTQVSSIPIKELLREGKVYFFMVHWLLAYIQKKIGDEMGVQPGAEMINAIDAAEASGAKVALIDRDIQVTLQRFWNRWDSSKRYVWLVLSSVHRLGLVMEKTLTSIILQIRM